MAMLSCKGCKAVTDKKPASSTVKEIMDATGYEPVFSYQGGISYYCGPCAKLIGDKAREIQKLLNDPEAYLAWVHVVKLGERP